MTETADGVPQRRTYRAPLSQAVLITTVFGGSGTLVLLRFDDPPVALMIVVVALLVPLILVILGAVWLSRTVVDESHVTVRTLLRTRRLAWRDIQKIEIERNPGAVINRLYPKEIAVVYDRDGRRIPLPYLHDGPGVSARHEVLVMRATWERWRGEDWALLPATEAATTRSAAQTRTAEVMMLSTRRALMAATGTLFALIVLFLISIYAGGPAALLEVSDGMFIGLPLVAFAAVYLITFVRNRRR